MIESRQRRALSGCAYPEFRAFVDEQTLRPFVIRLGSIDDRPNISSGLQQLQGTIGGAFCHDT